MTPAIIPNHYIFQNLIPMTEIIMVPTYVIYKYSATDLYNKFWIYNLYSV